MSLVKSIIWTLLLIIAGLVLIQAIRLLMLKKDLTAYKQYWEKQAAQTTDPNGVLYVALGDSAAQGIGASEPTKGYVGLLAKQLAKVTSNSVHVINLSVTGAKIQDVTREQLPRLQQMNLPSGTIVTIEIGANDLGDFEPDKFSSQMDELLRQLPPQTIVADMPYFGGGRAKNKEPAAERASEIIEGLTAKYKLRVAPLHETTKNNDSIRNYGADFFHPSDKGYQNWYRAFIQALNL